MLVDKSQSGSYAFCEVLSPGFPTAYLAGRRTSVLSASSTRILAVTLLAGFLPGVKANCRVDSYVYVSHICGGLFPLILMSSPPLSTPGMASEDVAD